jgi:signal peptidase I
VSDESGGDAPEQPPEPTFREKVWEQVSTLGLAVLIALAIRAFVIEPFRIPSGSMLPTLLIGDHLFVNKFIYGAQIPFTTWRLPAIRDPERGDVVVFRVARDAHGGIYPADERPDLPKDDFVKRIVGLPGERIEVRSGGEVYVDGHAIERIKRDRPFRDELGRYLDVAVEELGDCEHLVLDDPGRPGQTVAAFTVPANRYFMMGDNRDNSNDSRKWGSVHFDDFKGPAFILYWSWDHNGNFLAFFNPVNWFAIEKRWDRIFHRVRCGDLEAPEAAGRAGSMLLPARPNRG